MREIIWTEYYVLGIDLIDSHHKHFISLINETNSCIENGAPIEELNKILNSLVDYARYHFTAEEEWMKEHDYPFLREHHDNHNAFMTKMIGFQKRLLSGHTVAEALSMYISSWLMDHILSCDTLYANYPYEDIKQHAFGESR